MPQFIAAVGYALSAAGAVGGAAYAAGAFMVTYASAIWAGAMLIGSAAMSQSQARRAQRKQREAYNASQVDRMHNVVTTIGQRELVMGRVRKAGTVFARASTGANKEKFCMAIALAGHEIDGVETVYFNDQAVTLDGSGNVTSAPYALTRKGTAIEPFAAGPTVTLGHTPVADTISATYTTGTGQDAVTTQLQVSVVGTTATITTDGSTPYTGDGSITYQYEDAVSKAQVRIYLGTDSQTADADLQALFPGDWTADHRARGVAYLVCEFDYDETAFPSGLPSVSALIRGAKLYDPRDASTAFSENPALMVRHLLTHASFGKRTSLTAAEDARIAAAANACDTSTDYVVSGVTDTRELFTAGYVIPYGAPAKDALDDLCQAMGGMWAYAGGQFYLRAGVHTASVMTLTEADLAVVRRGADGSEQQQPIVIGAHKARADKVNVITPRIWDAAQGYKQVALTPLAPAALIARDGAWLAQEVDMPAVTYSPQALHVAGIIIRDDRDSLRVTLPFKLRAYPIELFDTVALTLARYGWSAKEFIVLGRTWTHDGSIQLTLKETAAEIYQLDAEFDPQGYAENTNLPSPWDIDPPTGIAVTSGTADLLRQADGTIVPRVKVAWDAITDKSLLYGGQVEVRYRLATETGWHTVSVPAEETYVYLLGAKEGDVGYCQLRCRNSIAVSDWSLQITHQVAGKSEAPGSITGFAATAVIGGIRLSGTLPTDVDIGTVELWINTVNSEPITGSATFQTSGLADSFVFPIANSAGVRYFWARVVDTSGNPGPFTAAVSATALQSGDADISALAAPKITGTLTDSQIADIAAAKVTGQITSTQITDGAISTPKLAAGSVTAAKIGAGEVTADKLTVSTLSAITANLGTVTAGTISGTGNISITGLARFEGNTSPDSVSLSAAVVANDTGGRDYGVWAKGVVVGLGGYSLSAGGIGVEGGATAATGIGVHATNLFGGTALKVEGPMTIDNSTKVVNLNADQLDGLDSTAFATAGHNHAGTYLPVAGTAADSSALGGTAASGWARTFPTDSGTANASGAGINFNCTITGYQFTGSSNNVGLAPVSDRRLKEGVAPETLGLAFINQLKPVSYRMKGKSRTHHGFVAQDVEEIIRGRGVFGGDDALAVESPDGVKGVDYIALIAPLVKAMQEIDAKISVLERRQGGA